MTQQTWSNFTVSCFKTIVVRVILILIAIVGWPKHGMIPPPQKRFHNQWHRKFYCTECFFLHPPTLGNAHTGLVFCSDTHPHLIPCSISDKNQRYLPLLGTVLASPKKWKETWEWTSIIFSIIPHWTSRLNVSVWATKSLATCHIATAHTYDEQDLNKQTNKTTQHPNVCILIQVIAKQPHKLNHYSLNILLWHSFSQFLSVYFGQKQITASKESKHFWV